MPETTPPAEDTTTPRPLTDLIGLDPNLTEGLPAVDHLRILRQDHPDQAAYEAVYEVIREYPPRSTDSYGIAAENARLWRAVQAALDVYRAERDAAVKHAEEAGAALAAERAGLAEWHCPSCGATTRARMADHQAEPEYEYSVDYGGITWPAPTREAAIRLAAGSASGRAKVIRRTLGAWEVDSTVDTTQDGHRDA